MSPRVPFSTRPGRHERHLLRKLDNPLFPRPILDYEDASLLDAQRQDHEELLEFITGLRKLIESVINLKPNEESQRILDLKGEFDKAYEKACTLADDQAGNKSAISEMIKVIMQVIRRSAGDDPMALQEFADEELARSNHFRLCEHVLVADLLDPDSLILEDELVAVLLGAPEEEFSSALELFDEDQRAVLAQQAQAAISRFDTPDTDWLQRIAQMGAVG
jgi:hypothetical protein